MEKKLLGEVDQKQIADFLGKTIGLRNYVLLTGDGDLITNSDLLTTTQIVDASLKTLKAELFQKLTELM